MVLLMYWEDNGEEKRKARREEKLRAKKFGTPEPSEPDTQYLTDMSAEKILEVLSQQTTISLEQSKKIEQLSQVILEQQKTIDKISNQKTEIITREIVREVEGDKQVEDSKKEKFVKLDDIDVNVIDTSGIESVGEVVGTVTQGQNITSQVEKLKMLKRHKKGDKR
jgi:hypothetical protein